MVEKNIGRFGVGSFADITHVVSVPSQSSSANIDPVLIPKEELKGDAGTDGLSAYEIAVVEGFEGTEAEWLDSLKGSPGVDGSDGTDGTDGKSAYEIAVENGFVGNESAWLVSLKGADGSDGTDGTNGTDGSDGKSAYEIAVDNGFEGSEVEWLASLKGADGTDGTDGTDGVDGNNAPNVIVQGSADNTTWGVVDSNSIYIRFSVDNGSTWSASTRVRGTDGTNGTDGDDGADAPLVQIQGSPDGDVYGDVDGTTKFIRFSSDDGATWSVGIKIQGEDGVDGSDGIDGTNGKSAYELAVDGGFSGDQTAWLASLKGADGADGTDGIDGAKGDDGDSAYEIAVTNGFVGDETAWLASLKGADGTDGTDGTNAPELQIQGSPDDATWGTVDSTSAYLRFSVDDGNTWSSSTKIRGEDGSDGTDGSDGNDGADGKSAYQVAVDEGFVGDEAAWLASLKGADGADGADGSAGADAPEAIIQGSPDDSTWGVVDNTTVYIRVSTDGGDTYSSSTRVRGLDGADGTNGTDGADGVVPLTTILTVSGTTHTFAIANAEKYHRFTSASAKTITVPTNASAAFPFTAEGETTTLIGINAGDGTLTLAADSGVTINYKADLSLNIPKWGGFVLTKVGADEWDLVGDMDPA